MKLLKIPAWSGLFIHIAKTGGTSVKDSGIMDRNSKFYCYSKDHDAHEAMKNQVGSKNWNSMFKFCFVRNPYDRIVSFYYMITTRRMFSPILRNRRRQIGKRTFKEFCFMFGDNEILRDTPALRKQHHYITNKNGQIMVDYVGRYEKLQQDWDYLCENIFHHKYVLPHNNRGNRRKDYMSYYDEETKQVISNYYKKDFEMFGYNK